MKSELSTNRRILLIGRMIVVFVGCLFLFPLCLGSAAAQSVPQLVNYQGMLTDDGGIELPTKEYELRFSIYTEAMGGTPVWGPQVFDGDPGIGHGAKVPVVQGHFNVILGPKDVWAKNITEAFVSEKTYLEITVNGSSPITPRQQILSTPYAIQAERATHGVPAGTVLPFAGTAAPVGYLWCHGQSISRLVYPDLWSAIGTTYGGDGNPNFSLPNLQGRIPIGAGTGTDTPTGGQTRDPVTKSFNIGEKAGEYVHTLNTSEMPSHRHSYTWHGTGTGWIRLTGGDTYQHHADKNDNTGLTGGDQAHNNMSPYLTLNYIIKY